jgi:two-component system, OmpR family, sensor kinase
MRRRLARLPLRTRLVAGFVAVMLVLLTAAGAFVYWRVQYALDRGLDGELSNATVTLAPLVGNDGTMTSPQSADATGAGWQVLAPDGTVLDSGGPAPDRPLVSASDLQRVGTHPHTFDIGDLLPASEQPYRVRVSALDHRTAYLLVAVRRDHRDEALRELLAQLTLAMLGALAVAAVVGDLLARAALRPVERFRRRAAEIAATPDRSAGIRLDVPPERDDEVTRLGHTLNDMLDALEESLERERQFVNDASHELRTPLTLLTSRIQLARRRSRSVQEHERVLEELEVDLARLTALANQLLELGASDASTGVCDLGSVAAAVVEHRRMSRPAESTGLVVELPATPVVAAVGSHAAERVVTNLVENAFVHGRAPVRVTAGSSGRYVWLQVSDRGPGMSPDLLATATGRFTRSADARARPGAGLGLSLVERVVVDAGGELRLCFDGHHLSSGDQLPVACHHDADMTVTVLLPGVETPDDLESPPPVPRLTRSG